MIWSRQRPPRRKAAKEDYGTPWPLFTKLHEVWNFTLDACATAENTKLPRFVSPEEDGLRRSWAGERVWCNPPFSQADDWVEKAARERVDALAVLLLPADPSTRLFARVLDAAQSVTFLTGRVRFDGGPGNPQGAHMIAVFHRWQHAPLSVSCWDWRRRSYLTRKDGNTDANRY